MTFISRVTTSLALISAACMFAACGKDRSDAGAAASAGHAASNAGSAGKNGSGTAGNSGGGSDSGSGAGTRAGGGIGSVDAGDAGDSVDSGAAGERYSGPSVGTAKQFAALAYSAVTTANTSTMLGSIGVSSAAMSTITGFDGPAYTKYGTDSLAPNTGLTGIAQGDVTALVGDIDARACDTDLTNVVGGLTGDITLSPGVTCMNSFSADILVNGHVYLDAGGDRNAFFIIVGNRAMNVADGAQVVLMNDAQTCGVFWRISKAVTIGKTVEFQGTVIAGSAITLKSASSLNGRALAQTEGVQLDANTIAAPSDAECPHVQ